MKKYSAEAICELNPRTASRYGLKEGEMIWIESRKGRIQQRLKISEHVHPNVILAAFGWWDTEAEDNEYDWRKQHQHSFRGRWGQLPGDRFCSIARHSRPGLRRRAVVG
jgi:anaerobic selenocysteine-containing dehydrogenase